ncbi:hypothetical protein [Thioalkalivibrio sp. ALJ7]|uniref:hypothetical protein n=1 Tax=Thioalkalivibrio sp. ALJ7 TaxID=1158756 RepID=UPI0018CA3E79|nr:hypothetical protein [Thioalkalivibrio sp. ALJ7]
MKKSPKTYGARAVVACVAAVGLVVMVGCSDTDTGEQADDAFEEAVDAVDESGDEARGWIEDLREEDEIQREEEENEEQYEEEAYDEYRDGNPVRMD